MSLLFFVLLMILIGFALNYFMDLYFKECRLCQDRKLAEAMKDSGVDDRSLDECLDELMNE